MHPKFLLRFDDICPTMNWAVWEAIERQLRLQDVRPILAVVPDNQDPKLMVDPPAADFWDRVRRWQGMGYAIALHGYQHRYVNRERGLMRLTAHSEFTGLSYPEQKDKLVRGLAIFAAQGVRADAWVAPSHSFDRTTLRILAELGLTVISDGLWPWPHRDVDHLVWVPQQLWQFEPKPAGTWTVCSHHNARSDRKLAAFLRDLSDHAERMTDLDTVVKTYGGRALTSLDQLSAFCNLMWNHRIKPPLSQLRRRLREARSTP